jgi:hypothetical protein
MLSQGMTEVVGVRPGDWGGNRVRVEKSETLPPCKAWSVLQCSLSLGAPSMISR